MIRERLRDNAPALLLVLASAILAVIGNGRPSRRCCPSAAASTPCLCLDSNCRGGCFFVNGGHFEGILLMGSLFLLFFQGGHFRGGLFLLFKCGRCLFFARQISRLKSRWLKA